MTDYPPPTPRPKLGLVPTPRPPQGAAADPQVADNESILDGLFASNEARTREPLGAARTLVWLAHAALLDVSQGAPASAEEWRTTQAVVEGAVRQLVVAQAQRILDVPIGCLRGTNSPFLAVLRQLTKLLRRAKGPSARAGEQVWRLAHRLELAVQCLFEWNADGAVGVSKEEVFALAWELQFVYRELQALVGQQRRGGTQSA
jgi:hypothetical protein